MLRVIKMDTYRVLRSKMTYILLGAVILFSLFMMGSFAMLELSMRYMDAETLGAETMTLLEATVPKNVDGYMQMFLFGNFAIVFFIIFAITFVSSEYQSGYVKNTAVNILPRYLTYFSKLIITTVFSTVVFILIAAIVLVGCKLVGVNEIVNAKGILKMVLVQLLSNISLTSFFMMIFYASRKTPIALISGLVYGTIGNLLYTLINLLIAVAFPNSDFDLSKYTNLGNIAFHVTSEASTGTLVRAIVVAIIFLAISSFFSCYAINKKDIK